MAIINSTAAAQALVRVDDAASKRAPKQGAPKPKVQEAERRYEFIVNTSRELMAFVNRDFVYEAVNDAYCQARSQTREEIIGSSMAQLWGEDVFEEVIREAMERCLAGEEVKYQAWYEHAALGRRYMDVAYYPYRDREDNRKGDQKSDRPSHQRNHHENDVTHAVVVTYDATRYMLAEQETLRYATRLEALQAIDRAILAGEPLEEVARCAAEGLRDLLPEQQTHIVLFEPGTAETTETVETEETEETAWSGRSIFADEPTQPASWSIRHPRDIVPRLLAVAPNEPRIYRAADAFHILSPQPSQLAAEEIVLRDVHAGVHVQTPTSFIATPLTSSNALLGAICVGVTQPNVFDAQHVDIVHDVAYHLALGIQQRRMERAMQRHTTNLEELVQARTVEIERRRRVAEGLRDVLGLLNLSHSLDQISQRIAEQARELVDASATAVYTLDRSETGEAEPKRMRPAPRAGAGRAFAARLLWRRRGHGGPGRGQGQPPGRCRGRVRRSGVAGGKRGCARRRNGDSQAFAAAGAGAPWAGPQRLRTPARGAARSARRSAGRHCDPLPRVPVAHPGGF